MSLSYKAMLACLFGALVILPTAALAENSATAKPDAQTQRQTEDKRKTLMADATVQQSAPQRSQQRTSAENRNFSVSRGDLCVSGHRDYR